MKQINKHIKLRNIFNMLLLEIELPDRGDFRKILANDDVKDYYGNTPYAQKVFGQWSRGSGEFKNAELFRGKVTGNYSKDNIKLGLRQTIGKNKTVLGYLYIPKQIYSDIVV